jgi:hypothetical protein
MGIFAGTLLTSARARESLWGRAHWLICRFMRRLTLLVVLVAFIFSCGGQWYVLQGIAWANMIREYSQMVPLSQAVEMTLSGHYPCPLCQIIAERKNAEHDKIATIEKQEKKILSIALVVKAPFSPGADQIFLVGDEFLRTRSEPPPLPPPRFA